MAHEPLARLQADRFPTPRQRRADQRAMDAVRNQVRAYALDAHVPRVGRLLDRVERRGRERDLQELRDTIAPYVTFHEREYPFAVAPPETLDGRKYATPFRQLADGQRITYDEDLGTRHFLLAGPTGEGKSMAGAGLITDARRSEPRTHTLVIDAKRELRGLATRDHDYLVLDRSVELNLIAPDDALTIPQLIDVNIDVGRQCLYAGAAYAAIAQRAYERAYARGPHASTRDFIEEIDALASKGETYAYRDAQRNTSARHHRAVRTYEHLHVRGAPGVSALFGRPIYFPLSGTSDIDDFHATYLVRRLFHYAQAHPAPGALRYIVLLDEGQPFFSDDPNTITGRASLSVLQGMSRSSGIAFCVSTNALALTDTSLRGNVATMIFFRPANGIDAREVQRTLNLTDDQLRYACAMPRGQVLMKVAYWPDPILTTFDPIDLHTTSTEYQQAIDRTVAYLTAKNVSTSTSHIEPSRVAAREEHESTGQPTPSQTAAPSSSPPSRVAPVVEKIPSNRRIPLNKHAAAIIEDVANNPLTLTTPCFHRSKLRLSEGDRAKTLAIDVGLLESHRVRTGAGRGKTGSALRLTAAGWAWLGRKPPKGTRGGDSVQHEFLITELARRIPHSKIETLGADLVIPYNSATHEQLRRALEELSERTIALNDGDLIVAEVESARPELTTPRNVERDTGFALTIIATLGKTDELQRTFGVAERVVIVDVLRLLDALRTTEDA